MKKVLKKQKILLFIGIAVGVLYGVGARFLFDSSIATISFLILVPTGLGAVTLLFVQENQLNSFKKILFIPWLSIIALFGILLILRVEDFLCIFLLLIPFFAFATLIIFLVAFIKNRNLNKKLKNNTLLCLAVLPFIFFCFEKDLNIPAETNIVTSEKIVDAPKQIIWNNIVSVPQIVDDEYNAGIFNYMGLPRPLKATVTKKDIGGIRTGYFEGGLKFKELITKYNYCNSISFSISVDAYSAQNTVFHKHVLNGNYFKFKTAEYELTTLPDGKIKLTLSSQYQLKGNVNFYGKFWADIMIKDFQDRLLDVIEKRCSKQF
ncbi:hypothetical protein [Flavobacterium rhizosphaerae]|uniref:Polyketide cyclase / dehydrase and lipid transport n=1 Tax=Flavobacterium rhizosphaerae TaxID=3163298 RepID=A0ABW8YT75_9FLAO